MKNLSIYKKHKKRKVFVDSQVKRFSILHGVYIREIELLKDKVNFTIPGLRESNEINKNRLIECQKRLRMIDENLYNYKKEQQSLKILLNEFYQR
ncbi:MAG: hypothetical protein K6F04_01700 [bacterium]|nr:hypothetical protein [bacterium]